MHAEPRDSSRTEDLGPNQPRAAIISLHTSPTDQPGSGDSGGMNVYILRVAQLLAKQGIEVQIQSELQLWRARTPPHLPPPQSVRRKGINLLLLSYDDEYHAFRNTLLTVEDLQYDYLKEFDGLAEAG